MRGTTFLELICAWSEAKGMIKVMKIGILSMQRVINYGSVLQAYSLKRMLEDISGDVVKFIDIDRSDLIPVAGNITTGQDYKKKSNDGLVGKTIFRRIKHTALQQIYKNRIRLFQKNVLKLNDTSNEQFDLAVIGSDEVFIASNYICLQLYGKVNNAKKVVSYAAACGMAEANNITGNNVLKVTEALNNIKLMSVRDKHTYDYVKHFYHNTCELHVDPVLAGELRFREHNKVKHSKYLIVYAYAERIHSQYEIAAINAFANKNGLKIVALGGKQSWIDTFLPLDPFEMLDYFYNAEYVITDTFHGTVFSIINGCKFAVLKRKSNEYKIRGVLESLNLEQRLVEKTEQLERVITLEIDYNEVYKELDKESKRTKEYLQKCIELAK